MNLLIMQFSPTSCHSSLFSLNTLLSTLFSNTLSLCSFLNARDQISHPYKNHRQNYSFVYSNFYVSRLDDVNLLGDDIETIKKSTQTLIDASKEVGL
jgi:hypothetical protein